MTSKTKKCNLGIDPGVTNLGFAIISDEGLEVSKTYKDLKDHRTRFEAISEMVSTSLQMGVEKAALERFVAYQGTQSSASEEILMTIGSLQHALMAAGIEVELTRALDWKVALNHHFMKKDGWQNPAKSFDKKYSLAMAEKICGVRVVTDHEADAICLAYYSTLEKKK